MSTPRQIATALIRESTFEKAERLANTISLHPLHDQAKASAAEIMRECAKLSDAQLAASHEVFESDEHGPMPDYFGELSKRNSRDKDHDQWFKLIYWELQERPLSCLDEEKIGKFLQLAGSIELLTLLTPRQLAYLLWPAFHISPKHWSKIYAALVDRLHFELTCEDMKSYPQDLKSQLRWLHQCWESGRVSRIPDRLFMPCNLSDLPIDDERYCRNPLLWITSTRNRGWWVALPNNMTLTDISKDPSHVREILSLCHYSQRLKELEKSWDIITQDPSVFPMLFQVLQLNAPRHAQTLREFFPKIPPSQVMNCLQLLLGHDKNFLKAIDLTRGDQLEAVLRSFFAFLFDETFCQKYHALFPLLANPVELIQKSIGDNKLRMYRVLCLTLPNAATQSNVKTLFSSRKTQAIAEQIYEVKKILESITLFAKQNQITPSAAAIRLLEESKLEGLIELWESRESAHIVLHQFLAEVGELINIKNLLLADDLNSTHNHVKIPGF